MRSIQNKGTGVKVKMQGRESGGRGHSMYMALCEREHDVPDGEKCHMAVVQG